MAMEFLSMAIGCLFAVAILPPLPPGRAGFEAADPPRDERVVARTKAKTPIALKAEPVETTLEAVAGREGGEPRGVNDRVKGLKAGGKLHLVLVGPATDAPPGVLYAVYLDLPADATLEQKRRHAVGSINFFNFIGPESEEDKRSPDRRAVSLDVTEAAKRLQLEGKLRDKPVVTIVPAGKPAADANPIVAEIRLIESDK